jgi:hypothetical protein
VQKRRAAKRQQHSIHRVAGLYRRRRGFFVASANDLDWIEGELFAGLPPSWKIRHPLVVMWSYCELVVAASLLIEDYPEIVYESSGPADFGLARKINAVGALPEARAKKIEGDSVWPRRPLFD